MDPVMKELTVAHLRLKRQYGPAHPATRALLKKAGEFQEACPHPETKPARGGWMCSRCNLPTAKFKR
jgi:hypothetical protein